MTDEYFPVLDYLSTYVVTCQPIHIPVAANMSGGLLNLHVL